jgi:hypothetical protein
MRNILAKQLKIQFVETLNELDGFSYQDGNPFLIKIKKKEYFIYLKNISPAYLKSSPDVTRVQLPFSPHFSKILRANIPFIILGYDVDNDTIVCWNPKKVKERLNEKSNVSLYSRESLQSKVRTNEFKSGYLSNGEKIIIFKRKSLIYFFNDISGHFKDKKVSIRNTQTNVLREPVPHYDSGKIVELSDKALLKEIEPFLKKNKVLKAVELCIEFYQGKYKAMTFKDWFKLVNSQYQKINAKV